MLRFEGKDGHIDNAPGELHVVSGDKLKVTQIMDNDEYSVPVYIVTDQENPEAHASRPELESPLDSDDMTFSESSSQHTMSTLDSSQVTEYFRSVHGFTYMTDENLPLVFPTDTLADRLDVVLHTIFRLGYGGTNLPLVADQLIQRGGVQGGAGGAKVLDFPTNSGTWVQETAEMYPTARFTSLDVKPLASFEPHPRITFEVYDFYAGITVPDASYDVVHARQSVTMTKDFNSLLREMHRVLKPGGILVLSELPTQGYEAYDPSVILHSSPRRVAGVAMLRQAWESQGIDLSAWEDMSTRLDPGHPLWGNQPVTGASKQNGASTTRGFRSISLRVALVPTGPWPTDEKQHVMGSLVQLLSMNVWKGLQPLLLMRGMEPERAQAIVDGLVDEYMHDRTRSYVKCKMWHAERI